MPISLNLLNPISFKPMQSRQRVVASKAPPKRVNAGLYAPMVSRIANIKPGCGGCGK
jgi:hypothetical protein